MDDHALEQKSGLNVRVMKNSAKWMSIFTVILIGGIYLFWLFWSLNYDQKFIDEFYLHLSAVVGIPGAMISAFVIVSVLEQVSGPIEFEGLGFRFKGASGPVVLWVMVFLSIIISIKALW
ncbi:hypothetical protein Q4488_18070 [Amphritea sp. 1_MG-2023]|uniref:hypothetical protein n=1 Tax=Amphritea sp. 1_MG-2023 TaxID=3062670 RepID=UPI0026E1C285|nr:hypothetical protein [Amphritea sp. 1_MG-2023]MDO6565284.1 hypothetical protein [Amphritea sp. 1_MG-2023]